MHLELPNANGSVAGVFIGILSLPLVVSLVNGRPSPWAYPPYHPPIIQERAKWMAETEMMMSDMPWAVAWYGRRDCAWLPGEFGRGFGAVYSERSVHAIYLTALTLDQKLVSGLLHGPDPDWGRFAADAVVKEEVPPGFPLKHAFAEGFPFQLFLTDRPRWQEEKTPR